MKKTTILFIAIIYVVSFLVVGLFGISIKNYNPTVYVDDIKIVAVSNKGELTPAESKEVDYYFACEYVDDLTVRLQAKVEPENTNFKEVNFSCEESDLYTYTIEENIFFQIKFAPIENDLVTALIHVVSTDGKKLTKTIKVCAYNF